MTLAELLIALMITGLVAVGVASILHAASYGTSSRREVRRVVVQSQVIKARLSDAVRYAQAVLDFGNDGNDRYLVLWKGDLNESEKVDLSELQFILYTASNDTLTSYVKNGSADVEYESDDDFHDEAVDAVDDGKMTATVWSTKLTSFELDTDSAMPTTVRLVTWRYDLQNELVTESIVGSANVRSLVAPE